MPDLLPIQIPNWDDLVNDIKQMLKLKFSISELENPLAFFHHGERW